MAAMLTLTALAAFYARSRFDSAVSRDMKIAGGQIALRVQEHVATYLALVDHIRTMWQVEPQATEKTFQQTVGAVGGAFRSFEAIGVLDTNGVVRYVIPAAKNSLAIGRNLYDHPVAGPVALESARTGRALASPPIDLLLRGRGFSTYFPIHRNGKFAGFISGIFNADVLLNDLLASGGRDNYNLVVRDGGVDVFGYTEAAPDTTIAPVEFPIRVLDRTWQLIVSPQASLIAGRFDAALLILGLGFVLSIGAGLGLRSFLQKRLVLAETQKLWRVVVEQAPLPLVICRQDDSEILFTTPGFDAFLGGGRADLVGVRLESFFGGSLGLADIAAAQRKGGGAQSDREFEIRLPDGKRREVLISAHALSFGGQGAYLVSLTDISDHKSVEHRLIEAKEKAELANHAKSEFLANISHELRTPLNAVIGFSRMMLDGIFGKLGSAQYDEYARDIHDSGKHLLEIINDILDFSKIEAGKYELDEDVLDVSGVVKWAAETYQARSRAAGQTLSIEVDEALPAVLADERVIRKCLINLLSNAHKFTPEGGGIGISLGLAPTGSLELSVSDTGIGIAADRIERVLQPFGQADSTLSRSYGGTGLGLSITRSLIELTGGYLRLESEVGVGTTVTLVFPTTVSTGANLVKHNPAPGRIN